MRSEEEIRQMKLEGIFEADYPILKCPRDGSSLTNPHGTGWRCTDSRVDLLEQFEVEKILGHCISHQLEAQGCDGLEEQEVVCVKCGKSWVLDDKGEK